MVSSNLPQVTKTSLPASFATILFMFVILLMIRIT